MLIVLAVAAVTAVLAHTLPVPFLLDAAAANRVIWRMPHDGGLRTVYLTYDDGPNVTATPALLDLLAREQVRATFFLIERHLTPQSEPLVRRMADEGHAIGLHHHTRRPMWQSPDALARELGAFARRLEDITGQPPCRAFRPHAGWRSWRMLRALRRIDYQLVGWGWMLWDWDLRHPRSVRIIPRLVRNASAGDIIVLHDGHHVNPRADRQSAVDITAGLVPALREQGFAFGRVCP